MSSLFSTLVRVEHLKAAWIDIKTKKATGGIDGESITTFEIELGKNLQQLSVELASGQWKPQPYRQIAIPKKKTEKRLLGMLSIRDKIVQHAIQLLIEPVCEKLFLPCSHGYRPGKGSITAIKHVQKLLTDSNNAFVLRLDIDNFFDTIDHALLEKRIRGICADEEVRRLIMLCVQMGAVTGKMTWKESHAGVPQGAVLSPILANLYMHSFDQFVLKRTKSYVRYADDFVIFCPDKESADSLLQQTTDYLSSKLKLSLNPPSVGTVAEGFEFLGITFSQGGLTLATKKKEQILEHISSIRLTQHGLDRNGEKRWNGICRYYGKLLPQPVLQELDQAFFTVLKREVVQNSRLLPNRAILVNALKDIPFATKDFREHQAGIKNLLVEQYLEEKSTSPEATSKEENRRIIQQRKREYRKLEEQRAEIVISRPGVFVGLSNNQVTIKEKGVLIQTVPIGNLKHIAVTAEKVGFSGSLLFHLLQNKIPFDFFARGGKHLGSFISAQSQQCALWQTQASCPSARRNRLAAQLIEGKLTNQLNLIKYFHKYHKARFDELEALKEEMELHVQRFRSFLGRADYTLKDWAKVLMSYESQGALKYWAYIRELLKENNVGFQGRVQQGATDVVNAMLNYGYAILYTRVWYAILQAQLNPYDSIIHVRQSGKPTFVFDVIELFRSQAVDRVVISLVQKREPLSLSNGFLSDETKRLLMKNLTERLQKREKYRGMEISLDDIIRRQASEIANFFQDDVKYLPYKAKW